MILRCIPVFLAVLMIVIPVLPVWSNSLKIKKWSRRNYPNSGSPKFVCKDKQKREVKGYFSALGTATPEIREKNIYLYKDITFKAPVLILGWVAHGKNGTLKGPLEKRRGIIIEYAAHYLQDDGSFTKIYSTDKNSKQKFFINEGNLAIPYLKTEVKLAKPVKTTVLRIFPQLWDGVPYIYLEIGYCHISDNHKNGKPSKLHNKVSKNRKQKINMKNKPKKAKTNLHQNVEEDTNNSSDNEIPEDSTLYQEDEDDTHESNKNGDKDNKLNKKGNANKVTKEINRKMKKKLTQNKSKAHHFKNYDINDTNYREESPTTIGKTRTKVKQKNKSKKLKTMLQNHEKVFGKHDRKQNHRIPEKGRKIIKGKLNSKIERQKLKAKMRKLMRFRANRKKFKSKLDKKYKFKIKNEKNAHRGRNGSSMEQDIDGPISHLASRLKTKLTDMAKSEMLNKGTPMDLKCGKKSAWRYSGKSPPMDAFSAFRKSSQAWRAIYDLDVKPFQFPPIKKGQNSSNYLQIKFEHPVKIYSVKVVGGSDENRWGFITKFVMWYKLRGEKWRYYSDDAGKRRNFYIDEKKMTDVFTPSIFRLPLPVKASFVRIYPKRWKGKPLLSIDFKTCDLVPEKVLNKMTCSIPLLRKDGHETKLEFKAMKKRRMRLSNNLKYHLISLSETTITKVTGFKITPPNIDNEDGKHGIVTAIGVQYQTMDGKWKHIMGKRSKIFSLDQGTHGNLKSTRFNLQKPVVTKALRIIPENWTGRHPSLYINVFGCNV